MFLEKEGQFSKGKTLNVQNKLVNFKFDSEMNKAPEKGG